MSGVVVSSSVGVCVVCVVVRSGLHNVSGGREHVYYYCCCGAVFSTGPGPIVSTLGSSDSRSYPVWFVFGGTGAIRFLVLLQKISVVYPVLH
jgi:hypothetical protein